MNAQQIYEHMQTEYLAGSGIQVSEFDFSGRFPTVEEISKVIEDSQWEPVPEELYDPVTFTDDVPNITRERPIRIFNSYLWIYMADDYMSAYFKFTPA